MKKVSMPRVVLYVAACVVVGCLVWWVVPAYFEKPTDAGSFERLSKEASHLNRGLPAMLDKETELMVTEAAPGMFIYKYRLVNVVAAGIDYKSFESGAKPRLVEMSCSRPETRGDFLSKGVTMRYSYFDKDKTHIATIDVTPADCGL